MAFHDYLRAIKPPATLPDPHAYRENPAFDGAVRVCECGLWPDHHVHTGKFRFCSCDACRPAPERVLDNILEAVAKLLPPPPLRRFEVGSAVRDALIELARFDRNRRPYPWEGPSMEETLFGMPIVQRETLPPNVWRLMQGDDVVQEGTL